MFRLISVVALCALALGAPACGEAAPPAVAPQPAPEPPQTVAEAAAHIQASRRTAIVTATERVSPAVVSITAVQTRVIAGRAPFGDDLFDFFFRDFVPRTRFYRERVPSLGSGVIVDSNGLVVTNQHVVEGADEIQITLTSGDVLPAKVVATHPISDVALLGVDAHDLPAATLGSSGDLLVGEWVIAVGNPFGHLIHESQPTVTIGVVSAKSRSFLPTRDRPRLYLDMIQTDAAINPGNSGGALADSLGEVVGINTFIFSRTGGSMGLGFAIPIDHVKRVLQEYREHGRVRDVWLGFEVESVTPGAAQALRLSEPAGAIVTAVHSRGPAYAAGLRPGDVLRRVNGIPVNNAADAERALGYVFVGDTFTLDVVRNGEEKQLRIEAAEAP